MKMNWPKPTQKSKAPANEMPAVRKAASGSVDSASPSQGYKLAGGKKGY
jgi:hypothetical protein